MKKLVLSLGLAFVAFSGNSQVIFSVEEPASISGFYDFTAAGNGWGLTSLAGVLVIDTIVMANDGTSGVNAQGNPAYATGCNPLTAGSLTGKIAMVFRGDGGTPGIGGCEFGAKALNCQNAGAIAVIIVNREAESIPMSAGSGTTPAGAGVTIPVISVGLATGVAIRDQLLAATTVIGMIGDKTGHYDDDVSIFDNYTIRPNFGAKPIDLVQNASEFSLNPGGWVYNYGVNNQANVSMNTIIKRNGVEIYNQSSTPENLNSGDSAYITTPSYSEASYQVGAYEITYTISLNGITDEFIGDNVSIINFNITDSIWSLVRLSPVAGEVIAKDNFYRPATLPSSQFEPCIVFKDPNASRVAIDGVFFGGASVTATDSSTITLDGAELFWTLYTWDDPNKTITNGTFNLLNTVAEGTFTYPTDADGYEQKTVFMPISNTTHYRLEDNQDYVLCIVNYIPKLFLAYGELDYYDLLIRNDNLIRFPHRVDGATFTPGGFGISPSIALRTGATLNIAENKVDAAAFPVPAKDMITVQVNASGDADMKIIDLTGKVVSSKSVKIENGQFTTSVSDITSGTYVFELNYSNGTSSRFKVVVSK